MTIIYRFHFNIILSFTISFLFSSNSLGNDFGFFGSPISSIYTTQSSGSVSYTADVFDGTNLGAINSLTITGGKAQSYKNGSGNVCGVTLNYRIYESGSTPPGSWSTITYNYASGSSDQVWETTNASVNVLTGLNAGTDYVLEIFFHMTGSYTGGGCGDNVQHDEEERNFIIYYY